MAVIEHLVVYYGWLTAVELSLQLHGWLALIVNFETALEER